MPDRPLDRIRLAFWTNLPDGEVDAWVTSAVRRAKPEAFERLLADISEPLGNTLTPRELDVLVLAAEGINTKDSATEMGVAWGTAREYRKRARVKLGASTMTQAVAVWIIAETRRAATASSTSRPHGRSGRAASTDQA